MRAVVSLFVSLTIMASASLVFAQSQADDPGPETFFQQTMDELKKNMQQVEASNQSMIQKNEALRKRIENLREHMRQVSDRRIGLFEEEVQLKEVLQLQAQGHEVIDSRQNGLGGHLTQINKERSAIRWDIEKQQKQSTELQQQVTKLEEDLKSLQAKARNLKPGDRRLFQEEEKKLLRQMQTEQQRVKVQEAQLAQMRVRLRDKAKLRGEETAEKKLLKEKIAALTEELQTMDSSSSALHEHAQQLKDYQNAELTQVSEELAELKSYRDNLKQAMNEMSQANSLVQEQFSANKDEMERLRSLTQQENELLKDKLQRLEKTYELKKELQEEPAVPAPEASLDPSAKPAAVLLKESEDLHAKIAEQEGLRREFEAEDIQLTAELETLRQQYEESKQKTQQVRQEAQPPSENRPSAKMAELQKQKAARQAKIEQLAMELTTTREAYEKTKSAIESDGESLQSLETQKTTLQEDMARLIDSRGEMAGRVQEEIATLKLRKDVLTDSIAAIQQRYDSGRLAVHEFPKKEKELKEYLSVLKRENQGLQNQMAVLLSTVDEVKDEDQARAPAL